jgi:hypothetical protein
MLPFSISSRMRLSESIIILLKLILLCNKNKFFLTFPTINQQKNKGFLRTINQENQTDTEQCIS